MADISCGHRRIWFLYFIVIAVAAVLIGQLYLLQIVDGDEYRVRAEGQYKIAVNQFDRNTIYFTAKNGDLVSAATVLSGYLLELNPEMIAETKRMSPIEIYNKISPILPLDKKTFLEKAGKKNDSSEIIAHRMDEETATKIQALRIPGVFVSPEHWRYYPGGNLASHELGFVGYEDDGITLSGRYGIESYYDRILSKNTGRTQRNFFAEVFSSIGPVIDPLEKAKGDIALTIEPTVQSELEKELKAIKAKYNSGDVGGIIIDPKTGEIYAMESVPTFDPNDTSKETNLSVFNNPLVGGRYEMGSVVKPLVMAAGLDTGKVTESMTYNDNLGYVTADGFKLYNYDLRARGNNVPMQEVLNQSLNTGMVFVMKEMGKQNLEKYLTAYGLGDMTKIDLPSEIPGNLANLEAGRNRTVEYATASFGQGISVTPIEIARALCTLGNGGMLIEPHLRSKTIYAAGITKPFVIAEGTRVLKPETSERITRMLVTVVDKALLGGTVKMENYSIAAKTGTAQISINGKYSADQYLHSFFGYFPAYEPKFLVFLYVVNPRGEQYASHTLTEPFMSLTKFLLSYYEVPP
ncbi:MAG: penicillin-binding protein 2, partial [Candidatus Paceibacterota bacterium]